MKCLQCGEPIPMTGSKMDKFKKYCDIKCQKMAIKIRNKAKYKKKEVVYPMFKCGHCDKISQLDFNPIKDKLLLEKFKCPKCKKYINYKVIK